MRLSPIALIGVTVITRGNGANTGRWGMSWQLWVLIATVVSGLVGVLAVKLRQAQQVFDEIVGGPGESRPDDLARQRRRHQLRPALVTPSAHPQSRSRGRH